MGTENDKHNFIQFAHEIGYNMGENAAQNLDVYHQKSYIFLPELAMFIASYVVKKTFTRPTTAPKAIKNCICFYFKNVFDDDGPATGNRKSRTADERPFVRVLPATFSRMSLFKKSTHVRVIALFISADYLKSYLKQDAEQFQFLFDSSNNFWIEEIMTDDLVRTVNDTVKKEPGTLTSYHYKLKAMELLYYLFRSLSKRDKAVHQKLSEREIRAIYKVRDKIVSSLQKPATIAGLKRLAGMNELKMRTLFTQVFGMGIYDYYQHLRMQEAARLLRDEKLSVSEAGYKMGFENLSHFSRVFEKHIGKKPKRYSREW
jgi:AraC-like DNA-binding protein